MLCSLACLQMFEWKTSAVKFLSCVCCVGAGMPVGPEGPMIFLGATLGGLVSQGTINFSLLPEGAVRETADKALTVVGGALWPFKRFRNKVDQRDFMTAGCAAGVAGAFGAPIGACTHALDTRCLVCAQYPGPCRGPAFRNGGGSIVLEHYARLADFLCLHDLCIRSLLCRGAARSSVRCLVALSRS